MGAEHKRVACILGWTLAVLLTGSNAFAQERDIVGSKDHPLISRYTGSFITHYYVAEFDEYVLPLGILDEEEALTQYQRLEGSVTQITYAAPTGRSILEIYRNYEMALREAGFEVLFSLSDNELEDWPWWVERAFLPAASHRIFSHLDLNYYFHTSRNGRYLAARLSRAGGDVYVSLCMVVGGIGVWDDRSKVVVQLDVIEIKPIEAGLVTVNTETLANEITQLGYVAIYGIYFDTGEANVKPESEPTLREIAEFLEHNPKLNLYVVGHTDNVGGFDFNMQLSQSRADAVVRVLVNTFQVDGSRLRAYGVGTLSPVASNKTEEGRARNRRVELVEH